MQFGDNIALHQLIEQVSLNKTKVSLIVTKQQIDPAIASATEQLQKCAARARETDRLANEADAEASRLRKEMKRARKSYRDAKQVAKKAAKKAKKAQTELGECLNQAFRDLAVALQKEENTQAKTQAGEFPAITHSRNPSNGNTHLPPVVETQQPATASA